MVKSIFLVLSVSLFAASSSWAEEGSSKNCVPPHEYIPFSGKASWPNQDGNVSLGTYQRVSPEGRFILRSFSGDHLSRVTLIEIKRKQNADPVAIAHETPFSNEAFPVQRTWRYLVDIDGSHYRVQDILKFGKKAKKVFRAGMTGFYAAASELPSLRPDRVVIRSLSWPNDENQGTPGELQIRDVTLSQNKNGNFSVTSESSARMICRNLKTTEGAWFVNPMISLDGLEFSAIPQSPKSGSPTTRIYKVRLDGVSCDKIDDLNIASAKSIFGFPESGKKDSKAPLITMAASYLEDPQSGHSVAVQGIHLYDRNLRRSFYIGDRSKTVMPDAFPGMTLDGRVIYAAKWKDCPQKTCPLKSGYVITDPYQTEGLINFKKTYPDQASNLKACITQEDVAQALEAQKGFY